jgi:histone acetyltransferase (RNA polymerase elongator complex component)
MPFRKFVAGFKVVSHMMPDLPNVGFERDIEQFVVSSAKARNGYKINESVPRIFGY